MAADKAWNRSELSSKVPLFVFFLPFLFWSFFANDDCDSHSHSHWTCDTTPFDLLQSSCMSKLESVIIDLTKRPQSNRIDCWASYRIVSNSSCQIYISAPSMAAFLNQIAFDDDFSGTFTINIAILFLLVFLSPSSSSDSGHLWFNSNGALTKLTNSSCLFLFLRLLPSELSRNLPLLAG